MPRFGRVAIAGYFLVVWGGACFWLVLGPLILPGLHQADRRLERRKPRSSW